MLQYDINSWHYRLVLYVCGEEFFSTKYIDESMIKTDDDIRKLISSPHEFSKLKPRHVNFCPYCRAVVASIFLFPFTILYKLIPKREAKEWNYEESKKRRERNFLIIRGVCGSLNIGLGLKHIFLDDFIEGGIIQIGIGLGFMFSPQIFLIVQKSLPKIKSFYNKIKSVLIKLGIFKVKITFKPRISRPHSPPFIKAFFTENHEKYCPPVFFVDRKTLAVDK